jgi:hypothetical protein
MGEEGRHHHQQRSSSSIIASEHSPSILHLVVRRVSCLMDALRARVRGLSL